MDNKPMALSADSTGSCRGYVGKKGARWTLKDGILHFYGNGVITAEPVKICGEMWFDPYQGYVKSPWDRSQVHTVIIETGITEIGAAAFYDHHKLRSVVIPSSVVRIRERAFAFCIDLQTLNIPDSVQVIDVAAFDAVPHIIYHGPDQCDKNWGALSRN